MITPGTIRVATVMRDEQEFMEQTYRFEQGRRALEIDQLWRSVDGSGTGGGASYEIEPDGCLQIRMHARRGVLTDAIVIDSEPGAVVLRSEGETVATLPAAGRPLLFDCHDPMLDWIIAMVILGIGDGETLGHDVVAVDLSAHTLGRAHTLYRREGRTITIEKGTDPRNDCRLLLAEASFDLYQAESGGCRYHYE